MALDKTQLTIICTTVGVNVHLSIIFCRPCGVKGYYVIEKRCPSTCLDYSTDISITENIFLTSHPDHVNDTQNKCLDETVLLSV